MHYFTCIAVMAAVGSTMAQNASVCDKYTTALFKANNATNQYMLLKMLVNTAVIGLFSVPHIRFAHI